MSFAGKLTSLGAGALFVGASAALWLAFGDNVYAAYLTGMIMNCF